MQLNTAKRASFDEGSLDQYLREISQYPLITREEEVSLAQRIRTGEEEALDKLVRSNLRFVVSVAKKYQNQGVALSDLINEGNLSLAAPLTPGEDNKLLDYLPDTTNPGPDDEIFEHALTESIEKVLSTLKDREAKILRLYFGLEGQDPMTLEEIGSQLGITRERVRQIKEKALARLRHIPRARALDSFLTSPGTEGRGDVGGWLRSAHARPPPRP